MHVGIQRNAPVELSFCELLNNPWMKMYAWLGWANRTLITLLRKNSSKAFEEKQGPLKIQAQDDIRGLGRDTRSLRAADQGSTGFRDNQESERQVSNTWKQTIYTKTQW